MRSCLMLAVQVDGRELTTIEGMAPGPGQLSTVQQAFWDHHGLQCGFCTPGMVMAATDLLQRNPDPTETEVREAMGGNLCRCTGYHFIVESILAAAEAGSLCRRAWSLQAVSEFDGNRLVGTRVRRREDPRLLQGKGSYVDDLRRPGMLHLAFVRSEAAHARVISIDADAARERARRARRLHA